MGLIVDSSETIAGERQELSADDVLTNIRSFLGPHDLALSVISVMELEHGIWRAKSAERALRRRKFVDDLLLAVPIYPVTTQIAQRAARIDAELRSAGTVIGTADILIGATALELGYGVVTSNLRHFRAIPGLTIHQNQ